MEKTSLGCPNVGLCTNDIRMESQRCPNSLPRRTERSSAIAFDEHSPIGNCPASQEGRSTIYRELSRNSGPLGYLVEEAQQRTDVRRWVNHRVRKMDDPVVRKYVCQGLKRYWSPDQIAGRSQLDFRGEPRRRSPGRRSINGSMPGPKKSVAHGAVVCGLAGPGENAEQTRAGCRTPSNRWRPASSLPVGALAIGKAHDRRTRHRGGLLSLVERKSGFTLLARVNDRRAATVRAAAEERLAALPEALCRTVTFDNGKEFAEHEQLSTATGIDIYFAHPYAAWERGTNEHTNGLVRQYTPKGTDFTATSHRAVAAIQSSLNDRPRKRLDYRTPREVLQLWAHRRDVAFGI